LTLYFYCVYYFGITIVLFLYCANFVIGLRAVKFLHTNKFELN
jgi:hypothetical protein